MAGTYAVLRGSGVSDRDTAVVIARWQLFRISEIQVDVLYRFRPAETGCSEDVCGRI